MALLGQVPPLVTQRLVDGFTSGSLSQVAAVYFVVLLFSADFGITIVENINGYLGDQMSTKTSNFLSDRFYQKILSLPQGYFDEELTGTIVSRLSRSTTGLAQFLQAFSNSFLSFLATTVFSLIIVFKFSWIVGLLLLALYPIYIWLTMRSSNTWQGYEGEKNTLRDSAAGRFQESITNIKTVKSFNSEGRELSLFSSTLARIVPINRKQSVYWHTKDVQRRVVVNILFGLVYLTIILQLYAKDISLGQAVALFQFSELIRIPIFTISYLIDEMQRAITSSKDYFDTLAQVEEDNSATKEIKNIKGSIEFDQVNFEYRKGEKVFNDISFKIGAGQKVALVGESGQGKSTLAHLLLKLYKPSSGRILIDGEDLSDISTPSIRRQVGLVLQEPALFSGTITENIAYAKPKASKKEVESAAKAANAHDFISKFKDGYSSYIGERGVKLSGGQKQRVTIARTILKDAPILVLDEATSSLDSKAEKEVQVALDHLMQGKTTLIIAHRLSTISGADLIVTLKDGKVDEVGSPKELAKTGGVYSELLKLQTSGSKAAKKELQQKFEVS